MSTETPPAFVTKHGRRIPAIAGYRELYPTSYWDTPERRAESEAPQRPFHLFQNHIYKLSITLDLLALLGHETRWRRTLDIGAMDATISRLLVASGKAQAADAIDLYDQSERLSDSTFEEYVKRHVNAVRDARSEISEQREVLNRVPLFHELCEHPPQSSTFWNSDYHTSPVFNFLTGDILSDALPTEYDLVTSFMTSVVLDIRKAFERVAAHLAPNGLFVVLEPYWWHPYLFFGSAGHFPYAFQRLDQDDTERYLSEFHADSAEQLADRLRIFSHRWTTNDYTMVADENGLELLAERRFIQTSHIGSFRSVISPHALNLHDDSRLRDVLEDIWTFRRDVQFADLLTSFVVLVFRKSPTRRSSLASTLSSLGEAF